MGACSAASNETPQFRVALCLDGTPLTTTRHSTLGHRDTYSALTTHALTPTGLEQQLFFLPRPNWPSSLSLARA
eukprot:10877142-Alexandrium_andersonii.AAC.1